MTVGVFLSFHPLSFTSLFVLIEDPVNSKVDPAHSLVWLEITLFLLHCVYTYTHIWSQHRRLQIPSIHQKSNWQSKRLYIMNVYLLISCRFTVCSILWQSPLNSIVLGRACALRGMLELRLNMAQSTGCIS